MSLPLPRNRHTKSQSAAPATQNKGPRASAVQQQAPLQSMKCWPCHVIVHPCSPNAAPATKSARQVTMCCACQAKQGAPSARSATASPSTKHETLALPRYRTRVLTECCPCHEICTPSHNVLRLPCKTGGPERAQCNGKPLYKA